MSLSALGSAGVTSFDPQLAASSVAMRVARPPQTGRAPRRIVLPRNRSAPRSGRSAAGEGWVGAG